MASSKTATKATKATAIPTFVTLKNGKVKTNYARAFVKTEADLTPANYALTLKAGRAAGHPWLDGSDKPLVMMLRAAGVKVAIADKAERSATLADFRSLVK